MWTKIVNLYRESMPLLMFVLGLATAVIGWNQYKLSKNQKLFEIKRAHLERCFDSVKDINNEISGLAQDGRNILRRSLDLKESARNESNKFTLSEGLKTSLKEFYFKWDNINTKVNTNQQNLTNFLRNHYQKLTYAIAFARDEKHPDPWKNNYKLKIVSLETGKEIEVDTDDGGVLPYGYCFGTAQKMYDSDSFTPSFVSKDELMIFLDDCIALGTYTFDTNMEALNEISNHLIEISVSQAIDGN